MRISDWSSDVCSSDLRRDIFARHVAALHLVDELDARAALARLDGDIDPPELAGAARLLLVRIVEVDLLREALAIGELRRAHVRLDFELALPAIDVDFQVKFTNDLDARLNAFMVVCHGEAGIFLN